MSGATETRFLRSTFAAYGSQLGRVAIRAGSDLLLARLILPVGHGLFDLGLGIVLIVTILRDLGLPYQLVRDERRPFGAVFLWELGAGALLALALALAAPLFSGFDAALPALLRFYAVYVLLDGLSVVPRVFFEQRLEVGRLVVPEIARGLAVAAVGIAGALAGWNAYALVAGQLAGAILFAALLWRRAWGRVPLTLSLGPLPAMIGASLYLFFIALAVLPMPYVARFLLGAEAGTFWVGQYGKARDWGFRLQELVLPAVARVLYPALIEYRNDGGRFLATYRLGTVALAGLQTLAAYFLFFNADVVLLKILIGANWAPAVPLLRILCFVPLTDPFSPLGGELLKARGQDRSWFGIVLLNLGSLVLFGWLLTRALGAPGLAWANYLLLGNLWMAVRVARICGAEFWALARDLATVYLLPLPLFGLVAWLCPGGSWLRFGASLAAAAAAAGLYALRFRRPFQRFFHPGAVPVETPG